MKVTYTLADKEQMGWDITDTFTLVGWWDYDELLSVHFLNVSKEYAQKIERKAVAGGMKPFRTDLSVMLRSSLNIENDLTRIGATASARRRGSFASASTGAIPPPKFGTRWALGESSPCSPC